MKIKSTYFSIIGLVCLLGFIHPAKAQKELTIGDVLDKDITGTAVNYVKDKLSLSDFKGKAIVIDFWATSCGPCVAELPKLDSLQRTYKDDLQIIPVTYEPKQKIEDYLKKGRLKALGLPSIVDDRELRAIFRHTMISHKVWLDKNHKVVAITGSEDFNKANIDRFIKNEKFEFKPKIDILKYDKEKPYLVDNNGGSNQHVLYSSIFAGRNIGLPSSGSFKKDSLGRIMGIRMGNMDILKMLVVAYGKFKFRTTVYNRTILKVKDSSGFTLLSNMKNLNEDWRDKNLLCYDLYLSKPAQNEDVIFKLMQDDIRRIFPYYARIEKKNLECLVLRRTSAEDKIKSKGEKGYISVVGDGPFRLINVPLHGLITLMNDLPYETPYVVDETNYKGNVDVELGNEWLIREKSLNVEALNRNLKKYDLEFVKKKALIDVMVIYQD